MTEKALSNNQAVVAGEIISDFTFSHEIFGEGFYMVDLLVNRLSDATDVIPLMVSDKTMGVYLAEPIADVVAVTFTSILFAFQFKKAMKSLDN